MANKKPTMKKGSSPGALRANGGQADAASFDVERVFAGGGEMGALIRAKDWSATPFGPVAEWPQSLRTAISLMLSSSFAMVVAWGPDFRFFYNDRYRPVLGSTKHPGALGTPAKIIFPEAWHFIGPLFESTRTGKSVPLNDELIPLDRNGYLENCYFTLSYSPIRDESGEVGGMLAVVAETTERVQSERRLKTLRDLARKASDVTSLQEAMVSAAAIMDENPIDVPFALFYRIEAKGTRARLEATSGLEAGSKAAPKEIDLADDSETAWPVHAALQNPELTVITGLKDRFGELPGGPYPEFTQTAVIRVLARPGQQYPDGILICGVSPRRALDDQYRGFYELAADHVLTGIRNAVAREEERERLQKLVEIDHAKTLFFSNVSHEFRTPLTLMLGPLEEMIARPGDGLSPENREQLSVVHRNSLRLLKLVNTLLDFSRIEAGRVQVVYQPTDLARLTTELVSVFRSAVEKAGLELKVDCPTLSLPVYVDRDMWEKIVLNLLSNAFKFTFHGKIEVRLRPAENGVEFSVSDTGTGIPENELSRVFERFHRIEGARGRTHEGTGIGLALVYELSKLHGGTVNVSSRLGEGSTFTVFIPSGKDHLPQDRIESERTLASIAPRIESYVEEAQHWLRHDSGILPQSSSAADVPSQDVSPAKENLIVLADDNADMREYVTRLLSHHYQVHSAPDGEEAVKAAKSLHPALVLTDIMMPGLDGFGVLQAIRNDPVMRSTPVILLSARAGEESRIEGLQAGADDYLVKPFTARELLARVETHIRMAEIRREAAEREAKLRAQAELEQRRLQELLAQAPAAIGFLSGPEHRWTYVNDLYVRVTGRQSPADFLGKPIRESLPELEGQVFLGLLDQVYETGEPFIGREMKVTLKRLSEGQLQDAYFNFVYQPIKAADDSVDGILVHAVEVTDEVMARRKIERSEERLRLAQTAAQIGTWEWDPVSDTRALSPELRHMFGTDTAPSQSLQIWASRVEPADFPMVQERMHAGYAAGSMEFEYRYRHPQHGLRWFYCKGRRYQDDPSMFGIVLDITERKQIEEARSRLAAIVESSDDAIVSKDLNGIVTSWNAGAQRIFGYTPEEMIGRSITTIIPPELHPDEDRILKAIARGERIEHYETVRVTKAGENLDMSLTISPVRDETGRIIGCAKIARNITDRKKAEHALRTNERLASVGRLAATIAHEINNPLAAVTNLIYLAKTSAVKPLVVQYLSQAEEELGRVSQLTKQTLGFYRETRGASAITIGPIVDSLISVFAGRARNKGISIRKEILDDPEIIALSGEIRQLIANLLGNSIDAVEDGGTIHVRISSAAHGEAQVPGVRLTIADNGPGIPPAMRSRIFEPFFTTKKDVGTGLGLWICKSIVEKHHGHIHLKSSVQPHKSWTVFSIFLPLNPGMSE
ncbi:MAG TPA: ATP-binding protein [Candidatus Angelobacter sp.]|nr:ATP-binding protein [Candidatus Angelobacter sp.]